MHESRNPSLIVRIIDVRKVARRLRIGRVWCPTYQWEFEPTNTQQADVTE